MAKVLSARMERRAEFPDRPIMNQGSPAPQYDHNDWVLVLVYEALEEESEKL